MQTYVGISWISGGARAPPLTSVLHNLSSRRKKRPSGPMHYIGRRAPPPRPGAAAAQFSSSAQPEAATRHMTRLLSSTMTSHVKTPSDSVIRRPNGGARALERVRERRPRLCLRLGCAPRLEPLIDLGGTRRASCCLGKILSRGARRRRRRPNSMTLLLLDIYRVAPLRAAHTRAPRGNRI